VGVCLVNKCSSYLRYRITALFVFSLGLRWRRKSAFSAWLAR